VSEREYMRAGVSMHVCVYAYTRMRMYTYIHVSIKKPAKHARTHTHTQSKKVSHLSKGGETGAQLGTE